MQSTHTARESYSTAEKARITTECAYQTARLEWSAARRIYTATLKAHSYNEYAAAVIAAAADRENAENAMHAAWSAQISAAVDAKVARAVFENVMYANNCSALERFSAAVQMIFIPRN